MDDKWKEIKRWKNLWILLNLFQDLGSNRSTTTNILAELREKLWIQRGTRAVFYDFTVYNANINLFCVIKWGNRDCTRSLSLRTLIQKVSNTLPVSTCPTNTTMSIFAQILFHRPKDVWSFFWWLYMTC